MKGCANVRIRDLIVSKAYVNGISVSGLAQAEAHNSAFVQISNVRIAGSRTGSGLYLGAVYLSSFDSIWSQSNARYGFEIDGYATSLDFRQPYASLNGLDGYLISNTAYSTFTTAASDHNKGFGYRFQNVAGVSMISTGAESNPGGMFALDASFALGKSRAIADISGLLINGCVSVGNGNNSKASTSLVKAASLDDRPIRAMLVGCTEVGPHATTSIAASGAVTLTQVAGTDAGAVVVTGKARVVAPTLEPIEGRQTH